MCKLVKKLHATLFFNIIATYSPTSKEKYNSKKGNAFRREDPLAGKQRRPSDFRRTPIFGCISTGLLTQTESLHNGTIALNVLALQITQQTTTLTYETYERAVCHIVLVICLNVLCQVLDAVSEKCNLALARTGVGWTLAILAENLLFLSRI